MKIFVRHPLDHPDFVVTTHGPMLLPAPAPVWLRSLLGGAEIEIPPVLFETDDGWEGSLAFGRARAVARYRILHLGAALVIDGPVLAHRDSIERLVRGVELDVSDDTVVALSDLWRPR